MALFNLRYSLPFRILLLTFILLVLPLLIFGLIDFRHAFLEAYKDAKIFIIDEGRQRGSDLTELTSSKTILLKEIAYLLDIPKLLPNLPSEDLNRKFRDMTKLDPSIWGFSLYKITEDQRFINVASSRPELLGVDYTLSFKILHTLDTKESSFLVYDERAPHDPLFVTSLLIDSEKKDPTAAFVMSYAISKILQTILKPTPAPFPLKFALLTVDKIIFDASDPTLRFELLKPLSIERREALQRSRSYAKFQIAKHPIQTVQIKDSPFFEFVHKGVKQLAYIVDVPNARISFLVYTAENEIVGNIIKKFLALYAVYAAIILIGGAVVLYLTKRMAKPFAQLTNVMTEVKSHHLEARYQKDPFGFEINYLGEIFNEMIETLLINMKKAEEEKLKRESIAAVLRIGHEVQRQLLPQQMPDYPKVDIADFFIPAKEVGGDFYDVFIQNSSGSKKLFFAIADVSGKGIRACLYSLGVRSLLRGFGKENKPLSEVVELTNKNFYEETGDSGMFVTVFAGIYDSETKNLTYISCGHTPAIVKRKNGNLEILEDHGVAIGFRDVGGLKEKTTLLQEGDILVLFTDGITEAHNEKQELFGLPRLLETLRDLNENQAKPFGEKIIQKVKEFSYPAPQHDDITMLIVHVRENSS